MCIRDRKHGGVSIAGITTIGGSLGVTGNITASGDATLNGGDLTLSSTAPSIIFTETNDNPDFEIEANGGVLSFTDTTNSSTKLQVHTSGITVPSGFALVGSGVTIFAHGGVAIAGITTLGGAVLANSSLTVAGQSNLNGNVDTRIKKLNEGEYDCIILAKAGCERLKLNLNYLELEHLTSISQGSICLRFNKESEEIHKLLGPLNDDVMKRKINECNHFLNLIDADCNSAVAVDYRDDVLQAEVYGKKEFIKFSAHNAEDAFKRFKELDGLRSVSYTHLTLPTIYSV
mgnify:CR=1 FL=1